MSDFQNAETVETVEEDNAVAADNGQNETAKECPKMQMHLQLTIEGDEESKPTMKDFETQESPEGKGKSFKDYETQDSPVSNTNKDSVDWKVHVTEEDEVQGSSSGPSADYSGCKTVDDDLKPPVVNHRDMETVEEEGDDPDPYDAVVPHKVIWKLVEVRPHAKNKDPVSQMIHLLPVASIFKSMGAWTLFGRGENVDVYLHDLVSSRKHAEFTITKDDRKRDSHRLVATIRNKSDTKKIKVNGNKEVHPGDVYELRNNDQISIGVFTFLIEIVPGDSKSKKYKVAFLNIVPLSIQSQGGLPSLYAVAPGVPLHSLGMPSEGGMQSGFGAINRPMPTSHLPHSIHSEEVHAANSSPRISSPRISSPSHSQSQPHRQPVENTDAGCQDGHVAQENDEGSYEDGASRGNK